MMMEAEQRDSLCHEEAEEESGEKKEEESGEKKEEGEEREVEEEPEAEVHQEEESEEEQQQLQQPQQQVAEVVDDGEGGGGAIEELDIVQVEIQKTSTGLGLYFACLQQGGEDGQDVLAVDGFVPEEEEGHGSQLDEVDLSQQPQETDATGEAVNGHNQHREEQDQHHAETIHETKPSKLSDQIHLGDILIAINNINCERKDVMEIVELLRSTPLGTNVLHFRRKDAGSKQHQQQDDQQDATGNGIANNNAGASIKQSFMGAFQRMKSKLKVVERDHDDTDALKEEQENKEYERQWLAQFDRLRAQQETKWNTCTYSADEFCGFLYHSADQQQKEYLLREYPLLMDYWHQLDHHAIESLRNRPDWPAVSSVNDKSLNYDNQSFLSRSLHAPYATIESAPCLRELLHEFRREFHWTANDIVALAASLEIHEVFSCKDLLDAVATPSESLHFLRLVQDLSFPRISVGMWKALLRSAQEINQRLEDQCTVALADS